MQVQPEKDTTRREFMKTVGAVVVHRVSITRLGGIRQTRNQTSQPFPSKNNARDKMIVNDDGSIDLCFGPKALWWSSEIRQLFWVELGAGLRVIDHHRLYHDVSMYLQRDLLLALPASQRMLMTMVLRKLLASSTFAIAATLRCLVRRLEDLAAEQEARQEGILDDDYEGLDDIEDEWEEDLAVEEPEMVARDRRTVLQGTGTLGRLPPTALTAAKSPASPVDAAGDCRPQIDQPNFAQLNNRVLRRTDAV